MTEIVSEISHFLNQSPDSKYRLIIGSDSHDHIERRKKITNFVTAIVVHRVGKGGRYFWANGVKEPTKSLRDKIYTETQLSLELAQQLVPQLNQSLQTSSAWELEIHIDVGPSGDTRHMIQEVVGMVVGSGYSAKTKPESYAASSVADKHT